VLVAEVDVVAPRLAAVQARMAPSRAAMLEAMSSREMLAPKPAFISASIRLTAWVRHG
jgi:hypothetical protein